MSSPILGKLYTLLEQANASGERKAVMQKALAGLLLKEQIKLLNALSDKTALEIFVKNFSEKVGVHGKNEKAIIESELEVLRKAAE